MGRTTPNDNKRLCLDSLPPAEGTDTYGPCVATRVAQWCNMGAIGIFLDEFGFDYQNDRARQNRAIEIVHNSGKFVVANAWDPDEVFSGSPTSLLDANDYYFYESHLVKDGMLENLVIWQEKAEKLRQYRMSRAFNIMSITTAGSSAFDENKFWYSWFGALIHEHAATGWGEPNYSASNSQAPVRPVPTLSQTADTWLGPVIYDLGWAYRQSDMCTYYIDGWAGTGYEAC